MKKSYPHIVKILINDDGIHREKPVWCYVFNMASTDYTFCTMEAFGIGDSRAVFKIKIGKITCPACLQRIKEIKAIRL